MDHQSQAEAFEVLPPATSEHESSNEYGYKYEYEQEGAPAQGEFEDEVGRDHRRGGAPVRSAGGARYAPTPAGRRPTVVDHRSSAPAGQNSYHTRNTYGGYGGGAPRYGSTGNYGSGGLYRSGFPRYGATGYFGSSGLYGGGLPRYGATGYYGARPWATGGYYGARPWASTGYWGRWPHWYRPRRPAQGWDASALLPSDDDDYPPQSMPAPVMMAPQPFVPQDVSPPPAAAFAQAAAMPMPMPMPMPEPMPAPADSSAPANAGGPSEFEFEYGYGPRGRGRGHRRGCRCGNCMGGSSYGGFSQEQEQEQEIAGGPGAAKRACATYTPGEVQRSTSAAGVLRASVFDHPRGTVVANFGVNWRTPRETLAKDPALVMRLRQWLEMARREPTMRLWVLGFSDCVGEERDNLFLRKGRATRLVALLERMVGKPAFDALRPRIVAVEAAPIADFLESNDSVEGRGVNRGVLFKVQRTIDADPMTIVACRPKPFDMLRYPLLAMVPNVTDYRGPLPIEYRIDAKKMVGNLAQDLHGLGEKAHVLIEAADWGITAVEIFGLIAETSALAGVLAVLSPVLALAGGFIGMGAGYVEAAKEIAASHAATGFSRGLVMGVDGASFRKMKEYFGNLVFPRNDFLPQGRAIATANHRAGLVAGYAHARALCPAQRAIVLRDLIRRMGDQSYRGDPARWTDKGRIDWYVTLAATFNGAHLEH